MTDCRNGAIDLSEFERQLDELHHRKRHQGSASRRLADKHSPPKSSPPTRVAASEAASVHARPMPVTQWPHLTQKRARACVGARTDAQVTQGSAAAGDMLSVTGGIFGSRRAPHGCMLHRRIVASVALLHLLLAQYPRDAAAAGLVRPCCQRSAHTGARDATYRQSQATAVQSTDYDARRNKILTHAS
jgi:hypothetical protein